MAIEADSDKIYDPRRRRWVARTPEEEVRQWFVHYLTHELGYPEALVANEVAITHNGQSRRCDTVVYDLYLQPLAIVEYKAPTVNLVQKVFDQIARYNMVMGVRTLMVTNARKIYACQFDHGTYVFLKSVPRYDEL